VSVPWMTTAPSQPVAKPASIIRATSTRLPGLREGLGRRNGERASISATSASAGTEATNSAAPSFGSMPPESLGTMVIVPPSDRTSKRGLVIARQLSFLPFFIHGVGPNTTC